jgi:hypothetical protein
MYQILQIRFVFSVQKRLGCDGKKKKIRYQTIDFARVDSANREIEINHVRTFSQYRKSSRKSDYSNND